MRTAFLGTSEFAAGILQRLVGTEHRPQLVVTPPDRRAGRGRRPTAPPAATAAAEVDIDVLKTADVNEEAVRERIGAVRPEAVVVCAFGQLIREPLLSAHEMLNVHPSMLPRWRGAAPIERAILAGDERTGVTIMKLTEGLDSGPIALQEEVPITAEDDFEALSGRLRAVGGDLLVRALDAAAAGELRFVEQDPDRVTYAEKIDPPERRLDPDRPAVELERVVRALTPHIGAYLELAGGERLGVRRARAVDVSLAPGEMRSEWGALLLGCGSGALRLEVVQPQGGKAMPADAYLRGHSVPRT